MGRASKWDTSCPDWEKRFLAGRSLVPDLPLNKAEAQRAVDMFNLLRLPDVPGQPTLGDIGGGWFLDIVKALFGSYDPKTNRRAIQEFFLLVPKKNGKSTNAAALMVTAVLINTRPNAEFTFIAPSIEVAGISFRQARAMIRAEPELVKIFHIQDNFKRITNTRTDSFLQIKTCDLDVVTGAKPLGTLIDETHVFSTHAKAADVFIEIRGALAARPDGFLIQITTQSKSPPAGVFKSELARARDVRDGKLKLPKPLLPILYELPPRLEHDWENERYWPLLNPNLGRSVDPDFLRSSLIDARRKGQGELALFASQHFNVEIGHSLRSDRWSGAEFWAKQADPELSLQRLLDRSEIVVVGIDGGGLDDLFGLCTLGRCRETKHWLAWSHAWCHESVLQRRQTIAATLQDFETSGELTIVKDELDDIAAAKNLIGAPQGYGMMNAIKSAERRLANGTLWHSGSKLMAWCVSNVKIEPTATAIRATKQNAGDAKIDAAMALFDAVTIMQANPVEAPRFQMAFVG